MTESALAQLVPLVRSTEGAGRVLAAVERMIAESGPPAEWTSPHDAEALDADAVLQAARTIRQAFCDSNLPRWAQMLRLPCGSLMAVQSLLDEVIAATARPRTHSTRWAGRRAVPKGVRALHAIVVDLLEREDVPRSGAARSRMVRAVDLVAAQYGIRSSVREFLRADRPSGPLMPLAVAMSYPAHSRPKLIREHALPTVVPGRAEGLSAPNMPNQSVMVSQP